MILTRPEESANDNCLAFSRNINISLSSYQSGITGESKLVISFDHPANYTVIYS